MKILITGATGFIGRHLVSRLLDTKDFDIVCSGRNLGKLAEFSGKVKPVYLDITEKEKVLELFHNVKPDVVFHCAAVIKSNSLTLLRRVNVGGTANILEASLNEGVKRVVYLSSVAVVSGNKKLPLKEDFPYKATNLYGVSKIEAELVVERYRKEGLRISILRPCFVYGEGEPHILPLLVKLIKYRLFPMVNEGNAKIQLVYVGNVVDVMILSMSKEEACQGSFFVADNEALTLKEISYYMADIIGAERPFIVPASFTYMLTKIPFLGMKICYLIKDRLYSNERLKRILGYTPRVPIYDGLKRALLLYR